MFDFVYENKKIVQLVLALIILPFALWGVSSYTRSGKSADVVASVNGLNVTQSEYDNALRQQQDRMQQQLGENFDASMMNNPQLKRAVLDSLVSRRILEANAKSAGLAVPDEEIAQVIGGIEAFQVDGKFDRQRYKTVLAAQNMSPLSFEARVREELLGQQVQDVYDQNGYAATTVADSVIRLNEQQRVVSESPLSPQSFISQVKVPDTDIEKYYDQNKDEFRVQEQVKVAYVKFAQDDLLAKMPVSQEEVRQYYEGHLNEFGTPEERRAAHILISVKPTDSQAEQDKAKAKAEQLLQQIHQNPGKFEALAKKNSQDPGSADKGGDLGFFKRGMMVKPFDDAAFSLKVGEVSGLVRSDFGFHIIKLLAIKPSRVQPLDEVREGIVNKLREQKAADKFAEMADKFSNTVYEQSDTLKPAADQVGASIEQSGWLVKGVASGAPWTAKMLQAIFNDEVIKNKRNTAAVEVAPNTLVAARILEYKPAAMRSLAEVRESIRQKLQRQQAQALAVKQGESMLAKLRGGGPLKLSWGTSQTITRAKHGSMDPDMVRKVFQADPSKLPQYVGMESPQNGYVLVRIDAVKAGAPISDDSRARYVQQLQQLTGQELFRAFLADARQRADIKLNLPDTTPDQP